MLRSRNAVLVVLTALVALFSVGVATAHAWKLTIDIRGGGLVEETQNPDPTRQRCGSLTDTTATDAAQPSCVSGDIYCSGCGYTLKATPAAGFVFDRYEWVHPTDIVASGNQSSWTWAAGDAGDYAVRVYFKDTTAPDTTLTGGPAEASFTSARTASFTLGTTQPGNVGTYVCTLNSTTIPCTSTLNLTALPEGAKTLRVQAKDPSGNLDASASTRTWTVDATPPVTTLANGPVNGSRTNSRSATFAISTNEVFTSRTCKLNGAVLACGGSSIALSALADGTYTLSATSTDRAGNIGTTVSRTWTVDTDPPTTTLTGGPANGSISSATTATFTLASDEAGTFACRLDGAALPCASGSLTVIGLKDGDHTLQVRATDAAGNQDPGTASRAWRVLATPPDTTIATGPDAGGTTTETTAVFSFGGAGEGGRYECRLDGDDFAPCNRPAGHALSDLSLGPHTLDVRAIDGAGNADASPASRSWTVVAPPVVVVPAPIVAPVVPAAKPALARISITATVSWSSVTRRGVKLSGVSIDDAPKGAVVEVLCPGRKACPYAQKRTSAGKRIRLSKFAGKTLAPGTVIAIKVTQAGLIGDYVVTKVNRPGSGRKGLTRFAKRPLATTRQCVPEGATVPAKTC
ncbi:Ig-like domain-containing protein [Solirubrobacter ginsenosidimutans]|uniref:Ig-like domain-containing protein n=1 Tax=Solirubrobacter ginsenosidimutans TaxID=490573 RepID=A0A9X3S4L9_9ACTN|nr:Ig-like domain-containing protein [Solirubrobacter ginsenosidimutans]MDA0160723.1 Ig-like domain-containing protein [Solirubrobacter ginsenosidimutans]